MEPCEYMKEIKICTDTQSGQLCFFDPQHPLARQNGMVSLGRHQMSQQVGYWLRPEEIVHYKDGNPGNLKPGNLELTSLAELIQRLHPGQVELICLFCVTPFFVCPSHQNRRFHCSVECRRIHSRKFNPEFSELEWLVWQMPTTEVAELFQVSDKAVEKRCKRLGISKPPRGYWAKVAAGKLPVISAETRLKGAI